MVEATEMSGGASRVPEGGGAAPPVGAHVSTMGWLSFFTMFVIGTDTFLVAPLLPLLQRELAVPLSRAGWLVSAYALGYALFALVADAGSSSPAWRPSPSSPVPAAWPGASGAWWPPGSWPA